MNISGSVARRFTLLFLLVALAGIGVAALPVEAAEKNEPQGPVTFTKDIAPILQRSYQNCHRPGSIANSSGGSIRRPF